MNSHETLIEQIRRLNEQEALKHDERRQAAINKIKQIREKQRNEHRQQRDAIPQ